MLLKPDDRQYSCFYTVFFVVCVIHVAGNEMTEVQESVELATDSAAENSLKFAGFRCTFRILKCHMIMFYTYNCTYITLIV